MRFVQAFLRLLRRSPKVSVGLAIAVLIVVVGVLHAPIVQAVGQGQDPLTIGFAPRFLPPSTSHLLGTDADGRDELALIVTGLWTSLQIGLLAGVLSTIIGVVIAFVAAYRGGIFDSVLSTITDLFMVIPTFPLLIAFSGFAKTTSFVEIALILAVFSWAGAARVIRSQVLSLRTRPYIDLARATKESDLEIIFLELPPNMLPYIALGLTQAIIGSIFALVGLEVIGLGPGSVIDLGLLINVALGSGALTLGAWPMFVGPIFVIVLLFFSLNLVNLGLEEVYNPRLRKVVGG
ncbi:MAG: ABC transporter permease [Candidatus Dormiibacterota bacterium]